MMLRYTSTFRSVRMVEFFIFYAVPATCATHLDTYLICSVFLRQFVGILWFFSESYLHYTVLHSSIIVYLRCHTAWISSILFTACFCLLDNSFNHLISCVWDEHGFFSFLIIFNPLTVVLPVWKLFWLQFFCKTNIFPACISSHSFIRPVYM